MNNVDSTTQSDQVDTIINNYKYVEQLIFSWSADGFGWFGYLILTHLLSMSREKH